MRLVARHAQGFGGGVGVSLVQVGKQDLFAHADAADDGLADGARADEDDDLLFDGVHECLR